MNKVAIFYNRLYDFENNKVLIGGIQTYIIDLSNLCLDLKFEVNVYIMLLSKKEYYKSINYKGINIIETYGKSYQHAFNSISKKYLSNDILILATDSLNIKSQRKNVIALQHGISWDYPGSELNTKLFSTRFLQNIRKIFNSIKIANQFSHVKNTICVDYNYFNWYRTLLTIDSNHFIKVIPNYSSNFLTPEELEEKIKKTTSKKSIVFSRRFVKPRGVILFSNIVKKIINEFPNVEITFAGDGEYYDYIKNTFKDYPNVFITSYASNNSIEFHKSYDIAIVPTIYSEGTSLSLLEAMAAGCFPIATHVGGMTNIIIDGYNGVLSYPDEISLYNAIKKVILLDKKEFDDIIFRAYETVRNGFSKERWSKDWSIVLQQIKGA